MAAEKIRILLADNHHLVRNGIVSLLDNVPGIYLAGEASNGRELVTRYFECWPDVVVTDISMPLITGIEAAKKYSQRIKMQRYFFCPSMIRKDTLIKPCRLEPWGL